METDTNTDYPIFLGQKKKIKKEISEVNKSNLSDNNKQEIYTYKEMLDMLYNTMKNDGLIINSGSIKLNALIIGKEGSRTVIKDWSKFINCINREQLHLQNFISRELASVISYNSEKDNLYIKGRFSINEIEIILKKYIKLYIICSSCKSLNTNFNKKGRTLMIKCNKCGCEKGLDKKI